MERVLSFRYVAEIGQILRTWILRKFSENACSVVFIQITKSSNLRDLIGRRKPACDVRHALVSCFLAFPKGIPWREVVKRNFIAGESSATLARGVFLRGLPFFLRGLSDGLNGLPCLIESISISLGVDGRLTAGRSFLSDACRKNRTDVTPPRRAGAIRKTYLLQRRSGTYELEDDRVSIFLDLVRNVSVHHHFVQFVPPRPDIVHEDFIRSQFEFDRRPVVVDLLQFHSVPQFPYHLNP